MNTCWRGILIGLCFASIATAQEWVQQITGNPALIQSITVDSRDNCFVSGYSVAQTGDTISFGPTTLPAGTPFLARYSPSGELMFAQERETNVQLVTVGPRLIAVEGANVWHVRGPAGHQRLKAVFESPEVVVTAASPCGNNGFVLTGYFREQLAVGKQRLSASNGVATFAARLNANGKPAWIVELPPTYSVDIAGTPDGGAYVLTSYSITEPNPQLGAGFRDVFAVRALSGKGELLWSSEVPGNYLGLAISIAANPGGGCGVGGRFYGILGSGGATVENFSSRAAYAFGFAADGAPSFVWKHPPFSTATDIAFDRQGNWFVGMEFSGGSNQDGAVRKNGSYFGEALFTGAGHDPVFAVTVSRRGHVFVAGECRELPATVGTTPLAVPGLFIAKFRMP